MEIKKVRYCERCGKMMNQTEYSNGFNRFTGEETKYIRFICPELNRDEMLKHPQFNMFGEIFMGHYYFSEKI